MIFCQEFDKATFYSRYLEDVLANPSRPDASFLPFLSGNRHEVRHRTGSFAGLTLNTNREEMLLALIHGIVSFQFDALEEWQKDVALSQVIHHVGGGAQDSYTAFKQKMLPDYVFKNTGETTLHGAAKLAFETLAK